MRVLVTGANRGIGAAMLARYSASGALAMGTARSASGDLLPLDVSDPASVAELAGKVGPDALDLLVCNAGVYLDKGEDLEDGYAAALWSETFAVNVTGVFLTVQALLPALRGAAQPKIAIIGSQMGSSAKASGTSFIYRVSKAAVLNLGFNLATALRPDGIAVGVYHPGWVRTDMGGQAAEISVDESAEGLIERFAELNLERSGCFETWDGRAHPI